MTDQGNIFGGLSESPDSEEITALLALPGLRLERIVSLGQATPAGEWLDQDRAEWVILLDGAAAVRFAEEPAPRVLVPGDWLAIPAHLRHRVEWTATDRPTVWLALHYDGG